MVVSSEDKVQMFVAQFARNSILNTQGKQPLITIPEVELSITEIAFKHVPFAIFLIDLTSTS